MKFTAETWEKCDDIYLMTSRKIGDIRKKRLFVNACASLVVDRIVAPYQETFRKALKIGRLHADKQVKLDDFIQQAAKLNEYSPYRATFSDACCSAITSAKHAMAYDLSRFRVWASTREATNTYISEIMGNKDDIPLLRKLSYEFSGYFCQLLRKVLGNPFVNLETPSWLNHTVKGIAEQIYQEESWSGCPVLADACEDAGCEDVKILAYLRTNQPMCRGDWCIDLLSGRRQK